MSGLVSVVVAAACLLAGCTDNQTITSEFKKCRDAGMDATQAGSGRVICIVPGKTRAK